MHNTINGKCPIMDVEVTEVEPDEFKVWFVALTGFEGPQLVIPRSMLIDLQAKIATALEH